MASKARVSIEYCGEGMLSSTDFGCQKAGFPGTKDWHPETRSLRVKFRCSGGGDMGLPGPRVGTLNATLPVGIKVRPDSASRIGEQNKGHTNTLDPNGDIDSRPRKL